MCLKTLKNSPDDAWRIANPLTELLPKEETEVVFFSKHRSL